MPTLNWIGREAVINHPNEIPYRLLRCNGELSVGDSGNGNLLVEGDSLEALKALLPYYAGQVRCIYIDPPYNTGNENWVYNDNVNSPQMQAWLGRVVGGDDLGRHDKWLCMMYPRLRLLWELLSDEGAIFISIDDNEVPRLRCIMDEIFGERNFVAVIAWQKIYTVKNSAKYLSEMHDYILIYAKKKDKWRRNLRPRDEDTDRDYDNPDDDPNGPWISHALQSRNFYSKGTYQIVCPGGRVIEGPSSGTYWRMSEKNFWKADAKGKVWWGRDGNGIPRIKEYLKDIKKGVVPSTWWPYRYAGTNSGAKVALRRILGDQQMFVTPKPVELVLRILELASDKDSLILDSFAGSGTTGHAVLEMNKEDGGNRRFILVELETEIAQGITAERLQRVIQGYTWSDQRGNERYEKGIGGGFRYCTLGSPLFDESGAIRPEVSFDDLAAHIYFTETGEPLPQRPSPGSLLIGQLGGTAYYLLFNGVRGGSQLDARTLRQIEDHTGPVVVYADGCTLSATALKQHNIAFKQIPYEVTTR